MWGELAHGLQEGDVYMYCIIFLAFIAVVIIFERVVMLQGVYNINFMKFLAELKKMVAAEDFDRAKNHCKSTLSTSLPKITLRALELSEVDPTSVKGAIEEETIEFLPKLESRLSVLPAVATLILLVGILGTIDGLWGAFHSIDVLDTAKKQASLANGIASSLNPTALGLLACMFILSAHQILKSIAIQVTERLHYGIAVVSNLLVPQEVPTMTLAAAPIVAQQASNDAPAQEMSETMLEEETQDDAFDDAAVEDIKDEEEII